MKQKSVKIKELLDLYFDAKSRNIDQIVIDLHFKKLYQKAFGYAKSVAGKYVKNEHDQIEVVNNCFIKLRKIDLSAKEHDNKFGYFCSILTSCSIDMIRKRKQKSYVSTVNFSEFNFGDEMIDAYMLSDEEESKNRTNNKNLDDLIVAIEEIISGMKYAEAIYDAIMKRKRYKVIIKEHEDIATEEQLRMIVFRAKTQIAKRLNDKKYVEVVRNYLDAA